MFSLMEIPEDEWADALYYVLMGCRGHGVSLDDDYGDNIDIAKDKLGSDLDSSPFHSEFSEFSDLAYEVVETEARKPDPEPDPDALWLPGDRVRVDARMPTGDLSVALGPSFAVSPPATCTTATAASSSRSMTTTST